MNDNETLSDESQQYYQMRGAHNPTMLIAALVGLFFIVVVLALQIDWTLPG